MSDATTVDKLTEVGRYAFGIVWGDGHDSILPHRTVRMACPCDGCEPIPVPDRPSSGDAIRPRVVELLGEQSIFVAWADGHETLLLLPELRALCHCARCVGEPEYPISGH